MADTEISILSTPYDIWEYYLLDLDPKSLQAACRTSKQFYNICKEKSFWRKKLLKDYPILLDDPNDDDEYRSDEDNGESSNWWEDSDRSFTDEEIEKFKNNRKYLNKEDFTGEDGNIDYEKMWKYFTTFFMKYGKIVTIVIPVTLAIFKDKKVFKDEYSDELRGKPSSRRNTYRECSVNYFLSNSSINPYNPLNNSHVEDISRILEHYHNMTGKKLQHNDICKYFEFVLKELSRDNGFYNTRIMSAKRERSGDIKWVDDVYPQSVTNFVKTYRYLYSNESETANGLVEYDESFLLKPLKCTFNPDISSIELKAHVIVTSEIFEFRHFENIFSDQFMYPDWVNNSNEFFSKNENGDILLDMALFNYGGYYNKSIDIYNREFQKREDNPSSSSS